MITTRVFLYGLPTFAWKDNSNWGKYNLNIGSFIDDALCIEQRISRGVNQENERSRYHLCCNRLEASIKTLNSTPITNIESFHSALNNIQLPLIILSSQYLDIITLMYERFPGECANIRLGSSFFPLSMVEAHINGFIKLANEIGVVEQEDIKKRVAFYKSALNFKCGIIEIQDPFYLIKEENVNERPKKILIKGEEDNTSNQVLFSQENEKFGDEVESLLYNEGREAYDILYDQVENAIFLSKEGKKGAVNFSNQPHNIITEVLNEFVFSETGKAEKPIYICVHYTDGSQGNPFPLRCLPKRTDDEIKIIQKFIPLRVALLSMRHLSMDKDVDMAWFRNREVSKTRTFGETDQFCYEFTKKTFEQSRSEGSMSIYLYQTGLQPAIIGFYRALIDELLYRNNNPPSLAVIPFFYRGKFGYRQGLIWC